MGGKRKCQPRVRHCRKGSFKRSERSGWLREGKKLIQTCRKREPDSHVDLDKYVESFLKRNGTKREGRTRKEKGEKIWLAYEVNCVNQRQKVDRCVVFKKVYI